MTKRIALLTFAAAAAALCIGCTKENKEVARTEFDYSAFAATLGTDFSNCAQTYNEFVSSSEEGTLVLNGFFKTDETTSVPVKITLTEDKYGKVGEVYAEPEDNAVALDLWTWFIDNSESLGAFFGAKYKTATDAGLFQTVDETRSYVEKNGISGLTMYTFFNFVKGSTYLLPVLEKNSFKLLLTPSFFTLDYDEVAGWPGSSYQTLADKYYILSNKLSAWGSNYIYFDYAKDLKGNVFNIDANGDANSEKVTSVKATLDIDVVTDKDAQLAAWKSYALGDEALSLGTFKSAYKSSWGSNAGSFESAEEAVKYVETNGRPGGFDPDIVVVYDKGNTTVTITLKSLYLYVEVKSKEA